MRDRVVVIGGGYIGQLVQLAFPSARVLDWKKAPLDHTETRTGPQYLWEPIPGVPSESFEVTTLVDGVKPSPERILAYKKKIGKEEDGGDWGLQFQHKTVGWQSTLPVPRIEYDQMVKVIHLMEQELVMRSGQVICYDTLVSTIPLPALMELVYAGVEEQTKIKIVPRHNEPFKTDPIFMRQEEQLNHTDGMTLNYLSMPNIPYYRVTVYGKNLFYESLTNQLGCRKIMPGKIHPHSESEEMLRNLQTFHIHCYGRFAAWRPDELAHQTWKEIEGASWRK